MFSFKSSLSLLPEFSRCLYVTLGLGIVSCCCGLGESPVYGTSVEKVSQRFEEQYAAIRTIRIEYAESFHPLADRRILTQTYGILLDTKKASPDKVDLIVDRSGRVFLQSLNTGKEKIKRIDVYDGEKLLHWASDDKLTIERKERAVYKRLIPSRLKGRHFSRTPLDYCLFAYELPGMPGEVSYRAKHRADTLFTSKPFGIDEEMETIDGVPCVVARSPGMHALWLDPARNFAVKKRDLFRKGVAVGEVMMSDFERVVDNVWLPRLVTKTIIGGKEYGGEFLGKPLYRIDYKLVRLEVNQPEHLTAFTLQPNAGAIVIDQTLTKIDSDGSPIVAKKSKSNVIPSVSYIHPADQDDLDEVIHSARSPRPITRLDDSTDSPMRTILIWGNIGFVVVLLIVLCQRWLSKRRSV